MALWELGATRRRNVAEDLEKRLREYEKSGDYVEDGLLEKAAAELKARREEIVRLEALFEEYNSLRGKLFERDELARQVDEAEAARDKALADMEKFRNLLAGLVGLIHLCEHRFPADLQKEVNAHWRFTEAQAALKETSGEQDG